MNEEQTPRDAYFANLLAEGESLKQEGKQLIEKYPEHAHEIRAMVADIERMRGTLAEMLLPGPGKEETQA